MFNVSWVASVGKITFFFVVGLFHLHARDVRDNNDGGR